MKREKEHLIGDVLGDQTRQDETLLAGANILRRRRQWRTARHALLIAAFAGAAFWLAIQKPDPSMHLQVSGTKASPSGKAKALTDEELLALFPDTPVGLAKLPDGRKILIFPRPGDEQRFVTRL